MRLNVLILLLVGLLLMACNLTAEITPTPIVVTATTEMISPTATMDEPNSTPVDAQSASATDTPASPVPTQLNNAPAGTATIVTSQLAVILTPINGSTVSGNPLELTGVVNGLPTDSFVLELLDSGGNAINRQTITLRNPNRVAQLTWQATLITQYRGAATIRLIATNNDGEDFIAATLNITIAAATVVP
ncbi:MAG: hypothetical protein SF123_18840 [Chloroflexota bacterium]|nr:hypothetical protein [Chloroflexota bacterium]